jgi:DNA-binding transcriptional MerR regulator
MENAYFRIGEVSAISGVPVSVLRFWESEFSGIKPKLTPAGQKIYSQSDIDLISLIKSLIYDKKLSIQEAKQHLEDIANARKISPVTLEDIRSELRSIRDMLK